MILLAFFQLNEQPSETDYLIKKLFTANEYNMQQCVLVSALEYAEGDEINFAFKQLGYISIQYNLL